MSSVLDSEPDNTLPAVEDMVKEIQEFEGLQALRLEGNTIGVAAAQAIAKALEMKSDFKVQSSHVCHFFCDLLMLYLQDQTV